MTNGWRFRIDRGGAVTDLVARDPAGTMKVAGLPSVDPDRYDDAAGLRAVATAIVHCWRHTAHGKTPARDAGFTQVSVSHRTAPPIRLVAGAPGSVRIASVGHGRRATARHLADTYMGEHWLATFALLALDDTGETA